MQNAQSLRKTKIYCVEDDESIRELIRYALVSAGFDAGGFESAEPLFQALKQELPGMILLDLMLPGKDGLSVLSELKQNRETASIPVIILTAKGSEYDKVKGLDAGADDYLTKPFGVMELISRVKALFRRAGAASHEAENKAAEKKERETLSCGEIEVDRKKRIVTAGGQECILTYKEFELLWYLIENTDIVLSRDKILSAVWDIDFEGETRTVDMHIKTLRQKLGEAGEQIKTLRGVGYKITP